MANPHQPFTYAPSFDCHICGQKTANHGGYTKHMNSAHRDITQPPTDEDEDDTQEHSFTYIRHPVLTGKPCDVNGQDLPPHAPPAPTTVNPTSWEPFEDRVAFDFAHYHFVEIRTSKRKIAKALDQWAAVIIKSGGVGQVPWRNAKELYATIDAIQDGECPWTTFVIQYQGPKPDGNVPKWMKAKYELCTRDSRKLLHQQLRNSCFKDKFHSGPYMQFNGNGDRVLSNLMSGDWAHKEADLIVSEVGEAAEGGMLIPVVFGLDKTTTSVGTGHQVFHPVYQSPGILTNIARRAHGNGVLPVAFLPIPKTSKKHRKNSAWGKFGRQMYHACLAQIFEPLKAGMTVAEVVRCPDGHLRRAFYSLGPCIADYPEQVFISGVVQNWCPKCDARPDFLDDPDALRRSHIKTDFLITCFDPGTLWSDYGIRTDVVPFTYQFPRADIHELLSVDLLHQVIKGTFKDHLVAWVSEYLVLTHGEAEALKIIQDIDRRISAVPPFPGLRRFPDGRDFEQWTGNDSKALMKVYLSAIAGHVPSDMVKCFAAFLDFCYIARQNSLSSKDLDALDDAVARFHHYRKVFIATGVRVDISLPRQHALMHYRRSIQLFGSPNGLCSSITESKHIISVKRPWQSSSHYKALVQMLRTLCRIDKMDAISSRFLKQGMLAGSTSSYTMLMMEGGQPVGEEDEDEGDMLDEDSDLGPASGPKVLTSIRLSVKSASGYPTSLEQLAVHIEQPRFPLALRRFLWERLNPESDRETHTVPVGELPSVCGRMKVHHSAIARFFSPSDICGAGGMCQERIRSTPDWLGQYPRHDTVFVEIDPDLPGMRGMVIARVLLLFSVKEDDCRVPCALVEWLVHVDVNPDPETGLWVVKPEFEGNSRTLAVIHLDSIARGAHLLPVFGSTFLPEDFHFSYALDAFRAFFVNSHVDHHAHEFVR